MATPDSEAGARGRANAFIAAFLAFQVVVPLTYYLGDRVYDERFGWRMFSTLRLQHCDLRAEAVDDGATPRPLRLHESMHVAWVNLLKRARPAVIDKALLARCADTGASEVRLRRACRDTDGTVLPRQHWVADCATGAVRKLEGSDEETP